MFRQVLLLPIVLLLIVFALSGTFLAHAAGGDAAIVISEVMFDAASSEPAGEWTEIHNSGTVAVDIMNWSIGDDSSSDTITAAMCPNESCIIPPGETWLIAYTQGDLDIEIGQYSGSYSVDPDRTIFLSSPIGSGLNNGGDRLVLRNDDATSKVVDCVSYDNYTSSCNDPSLTYVAGGDGADTSADGTGIRSIANIQGTWQDHELNASPYDEANTGEGGSPTAVGLSAVAINGGMTVHAVLILGSIALFVVTVFLYMRRAVQI